MAEFNERLLVPLLAVPLLLVLSACLPASDGNGAEAHAQIANEPPARTSVVLPSETLGEPSTIASARPSYLGASSPRWLATRDITHGVAMRVDGTAQATPGSRLADYLIRAGTERPLSEDLVTELADLIRTDSNFDDSIVKRCRSGTSVGFRLFRRPAHAKAPTNEAVTDLVLDFGCARLTLAAPDVTAEIHTTFFDASRDAFVSFVKRVLPNDSDLKRLR